MKKINVTLISPSKVLSSYKNDSEYQLWINRCIEQGVWGEVGNYSIEILDATAELEAKRQAVEVTPKSIFDSHTSNTSNPHSVTKSQIGLENVPNTDATLRDNHTGTQLASTISDFNEAAQDAVGSALLDSTDINFSYPDIDNKITAELTTTGVIAGTYSLVTVNEKGRITAGSNTGSITRYSYVASSTTANSNATYTTVAQLTTASLPAGLYRVSFRGRGQSGSTTNGIGIRVSNGTANVTTINIAWAIAQGANGVSQKFQFDQIATNTNITTASAATANTDFAILGDGVVRIATSGTLIIQLRSELNGTASSLLADSCFILELV